MGTAYAEPLVQIGNDRRVTRESAEKHRLVYRQLDIRTQGERKPTDN